MSDTERQTERFHNDDIAVMRKPIQASMTDGTILRGYFYEREEQSKDALPHNLLCLPTELGNCGEYHAFALAALAQANSPKRIYTLDLRGRGQSELGDEDSNTLTDADDLVSFCDAMNLHHCDVLVSGRTTMTVFLTGPKRPSMFRKVILNDGGVEFDAVGLARQTAFRQRTKLPADWSEAVSQLKTMRGESFTDLSEEEWENLARSRWADKEGKPYPDYNPKLVRLTNGSTMDAKQPLFWDEFKLFRRNDVLLVRGENSALISADIAKRLTEFHGNMDEHVVPKEGHVPLLNREKTLKAVLAFLGDTDA